MKRPPLVLIQWEDAYSGTHSWFELEDLPDDIPATIVETVGFELRRSKERTTLAMSLQDDHSHTIDLMTIPAGMIRKRTVLRR